MTETHPTRKTRLTDDDTTAVALPATAPADPHDVPRALRHVDQWVCWRYERRHGRPAKVPLCPVTGRHASVLDRSTWSSLAVALARTRRHRLPGIGFVFTRQDPYFGLDCDRCVDRHTGEVAPWALELVDQLRTYTEISVSGSGLHCLGIGALPPGRRRTGQIELYDEGRFFVVTGRRLPGTPPTITDCQSRLTALHGTLFPPPTAPAPVSSTRHAAITDDAVLRAMFGAANGPAVRALWDGDVSAYASHSEADLALLSHLGFWCGPDPARVEALFRQSALYRDKWNREDYRARTLAKALASTAPPPRQDHAVTARDVLTRTYAQALRASEVRQ